MTTLASPTLGGTTDLSLWTVEMSAGSIGPLHRFDSEQLWTVLDGELRVKLEGQELRLVTGDTIALAATVERQICAETDTRMIVCGHANGVAWVSAEDAPPRHSALDRLRCELPQLWGAITLAPGR